MKAEDKDMIHIIFDLWFQLSKDIIIYYDHREEKGIKDLTFYCKTCLRITRFLTFFSITVIES